MPLLLDNLVSNENGALVNGTILLNAMEYGLTRGCNWNPESTNYDLSDSFCVDNAWYTGVTQNGLVGNIFSLLSWVRMLAMEEQDDKTVIGVVRGGLSGPKTMEMLDTDEFWEAFENTEVQEPNVCHFDSSQWVWGATGDQQYCVGAEDAPEIYQPHIADFMSKDRPGRVTVDIAGANLGGGRGSASGETFSTQDESMPTFLPEGDYNSPLPRRVCVHTAHAYLHPTHTYIHTHIYIYVCTCTKCPTALPADRKYGAFSPDSVSAIHRFTL
jgi:hypothetical protein